MRLSGAALVSVLIVVFLFFSVEIMALRGLRRISCRVLKHGQCDCNDLPNMNFCAPVASMSTSEKMKGMEASTTADRSNMRLSAVKPSRFVTRVEENPMKKISEVAEVVEDSSFKGKVKTMWKSYGYVAIGTYLGVYITTLTGIFLCIDFDIFNAASVGLDPVFAINKVCQIVQTVTGSTALPNYINAHPRVGTFAVAWVMAKFTEPIRLGFTVLTVPSIARFLGKVPQKKKPFEKNST